MATEIQRRLFLQFSFTIVSLASDEPDVGSILVEFFNHVGEKLGVRLGDVRRFPAVLGKIKEHPFSVAARARYKDDLVISSSQGTLAEELE
jgi:hypothetical protein